MRKKAAKDRSMEGFGGKACLSGVRDRDGGYGRKKGMVIGMRVCIYNSLRSLVRRSGVGRAMEHQVSILEKAGMEVTGHLDKTVRAVHINTVFPDSVVFCLLARFRHKFVVYFAHSTMEDFRNSFKGSNLFAHLFCKWIRFCYNLGDVIVTPTEYSRKLLLQYGVKKPVFAVSNGIDTDYYCALAAGRSRFRKKYGLSGEERVVISVGHYIERKGILQFIELAKELPDVTFFWFGYTNLSLVPAKIREAIRCKPGNVHMPGYLSGETLREAYQGADLFCFMSFEETEGIVVLEALSCGIPVLLRDIPVYEGWLEDGIHVYKAASQEQFKERTLGILNGELPDLTEKGREAARERNFEEIGKRLSKVYEKGGAFYEDFDRRGRSVHPQSHQQTVEGRRVCSG